MKNIYLITLIVFSIININLKAQTFTEQTGISITGFSNGDIAWGDYNNDGYLDFIITGYRSDEPHYFTSVYKNNGDNTFTEQTGISIDGFYHGSIDWGDYDKDGDLDFIIMGYKDGSQKTTSIYKNNGDNSFTKQTIYSLIGCSGSVKWGDYDNDGDLDILTTGRPSSGTATKIYKNNGNNNFVQQTDLSLSNIVDGKAIWGDYDNDGDLDILIHESTNYGASSASTKILRNEGDKGFIEQTSITLEGAYSGAAAFGDYDNDGDLDILLFGKNTSDNRFTKIYKNNGDNTFTDQTSISLTGLSTISEGDAVWGDYDNDGYLDILITGTSDSQSYNTIVYKNNGDNTFTEQTGLSLTDVNGPTAFADYDNDGDLDIIVAGFNASYLAKIFKNNCSTTNNPPSAPDGLTSQTDGSNIIFSWNRPTDDHTDSTGISYNILFSDSINKYNIRSPQSDTSSGFHRIAKFGEIQDTFAILHSSINISTCSKVYWRVQAIDPTYAASPFSSYDSINNPLIIDICDDDTIIIFDTTQLSVNHNACTSPTYAWAPTNSLENPNSQTPNAFPLVTTTYYVTVTENSNQRTDSVIVYVNPFKELPNTPMACGDNEHIEWGDYDNDGDLDFAYSRHTGTDGNSGYLSKIFKNNGSSGSEWSFVEQTGITLNNTIKRISWGDLDNDGDLDLLIPGHYSTSHITKIYKNNGDNTFSLQNTSVDIPSPDYTTWGDYDNDGDLDILVSGNGWVNSVNAYIVRIYKNNGLSGTTWQFVEQTGIINPNFDVKKAAWADYNNDGYLDVILSGDDSGTAVTKLFKNNGDNSFTKQTSIVFNGEVAGERCWGDYDGDGDLDVVLTRSINYYVNKLVLYKNNGDNSFTEQNSINLYGNIAIWGDYNNDGKVDILSTGRNNNKYARVYKNNGDNSFTRLADDFSNQKFGTFGDYDNDGDLDVVFGCKIYENKTIESNNAPSAPTNLNAEIIDSKILFTWNNATDNNTSTKGLNYNIRISTNLNTIDLKPPHSDLSSAYHQLANIGEILDTFYLYSPPDSLINGTKIYYSVQTIDAGYLASAFSNTDSLVAPPKTDAAITNATTSELCEIEQNIKAWLKNTGNEILNNVKIAYKINGVIQDTVNWTGTIAVGDSVEIEISNNFNPTASSTYNIYIYDILINEFEDINNENDTAKIINKTYFALPAVSFTTVLNSSYCQDADPILIVANPSGGILTGTGINTSSFYPNLANIGDNQIVYSYTDGNNCSNSDTLSTLINALPIVNISTNLNAAYCSNNSPISLSASPFGGAFSGSGMSDSIFSPATATVGNIDIIYSFTDVNSCSNSDTISTVVNTTPIVAFTSSLDTAYCQNSGWKQLNAYPSGGTFLGSGVFNSKLYPDSANIGKDTLIYSYINSSGCVNYDTLITKIKAITPVHISTLLNTNYCNNASSIALSATPFGGSFSGSGINDSILNPSQANIGNNTIIYSFTNSNGCSNSDTIQTIVNAIPSVTITSIIDTSYCQNDSMINLMALPSGGVFYDNNSPITGNPFNIIGNHTFKYTYSDSNGCTNSDSVSTNIKSLPTVIFASLNDVCADVASVTITGGNPIGGHYSGQGITSQGIFYPQNVGSGNYPITYTYTDNNYCSNTAQATQKVISVPTINFNLPSTVCINDTLNISTTGQTGPNATFNWNFHNANIVSGNNAGPYNILWNSNGLAQISLNVTDSGCTSSSINNYTNIISGFAMLTAVGSTTVCYGDSVILSANSGSNMNYQWFDTSGILQNDTNSIFSTNQSGDYYCLVTDPNSCPAFSDTINVVVRPQIIANFNIQSSACQGDMVNVAFNGTAPSGTNFDWNFDNGIIASGSNSGPYNIIWNTDSIHNVSLQLNQYNCYSQLATKSINVQSVSSLISIIGDTIFCDGGFVSLVTNNGNYSYVWKRNDTLISGGNQTFYNAYNSGFYYVEITDTITNCSSISDTVNITVNTNDFNISFTSDQQNFTIPPFDVNFTNQTPNINDYFYNWNMGDGSNSTYINPSHQYSYDGDYTVELTAQNINTGCIDTLIKTDFIHCSGAGPNPCTLDNNIGNIGGHNVCPDDSVKLFSYEHTVGVLYQWIKDGSIIAGETDSVYYAKNTGLFQLMLTDTACSVFSQSFAVTQYATIAPSILTNGSIQPCTNDSLELYVSTSYNSYLWSNGDTQSSIYIKTSGNYVVTVTDFNNCNLSSEPLTINASLLQIPEICLVGIDSTTNHNRVIWERQNSNLIDSFRIYRESTVAGIYNLIGSQNFSTQSIFIDTNSNSAQQAYRYRITAIDTCGMETAPSDFHKTMHLTINAGLGGVWNLIWTGYEGFIFGSYRIYRGVDSNNLQLLTQIQSNMTSYTDLNPPVGDVYYQIEVMSPHPCYPDSIYSKANTNYNTSRSNRISTIKAQNIGFVSIDNNNTIMRISPNPNKGSFILEVNTDKVKANEKYNIEVYNIMGKLVYQENINAVMNLRKQMHFETFSKGVYIIRVSSDEGVLNGRFVVE